MVNLQGLNIFIMSRLLFVFALCVFGSLAVAQDPGCTDSLASNYDSTAAGDDGSCVYCDSMQELISVAFFQTEGQDWSGTSFSLTEESTGTIVYSSLITDMAVVELDHAAQDICLNDGCYQFQLHDVVNAELLSYSLFIHVDQVELNYSAVFDSMSFVNNDPACDVEGCTDFTAENYNPYAFTDDGSCVVECEVQPENDDCSGAIFLESGIAATGSFCCVQSDEPDLCTPEFETPYGVWYKMNSGNCDTFSFVVENISGANISMTIYEDEFVLGCSGLEEIACCPVVPDVCAGDLSWIVTIQPNSDYYFFVYTTDADNCGEFSFTVNCEYLGCTDQFNCYYDPEATIDDGTCLFDCSCAATNNSCFEALLIAPGYSDSISTYCLESFPPFPSECNETPDAGVWFQFEGNGTEVILSSCGSIGQTRIDVYTTSTSECLGEFACAVDALTLETVSADENICSEDDTELQFNTFSGETYFVYLSSPSLVFMQIDFSLIVQGDFNGNDEVDTGDLLLFLGEIGCTEDCLYDISGDGVTNVLDLLLFLSYF